MARWLLLLTAVAGTLAAAMLFMRAAKLAPLDLGAAPGPATGPQLAALSPGACYAALDRAGVRYTALPPRRAGPACGYADAVRFNAGGSRSIGFAPAGLGVACPVAAGLAMWEWDVVQPAALRWLGTTVVTIDHYGSYNCRRIGGAERGMWSEHAHANAIDVAGVRLADGRRITVARDWRGRDAEGRFLRAVRDGACSLFATVLSPDYNAAHRDHLHLDQASRGGWGWRACR